MPQLKTPREGKHDVLDPVVFGVMGGPGTGKSYAMDLVDKHSSDIAESLELGRPMIVRIAKKSTSRENRGADDVWKESGVSKEEFESTEGAVAEGQNFIGIYKLANNNAYYGYRPSVFSQSADILVAEPSIHHLTTIKSQLGDKLFMICLIASRQYRSDRMNSRGTEDPVQIKKRLDEGDIQIFLLDKLNGGLATEIKELIDSELLEVLNLIYDNKDDVTQSESLKARLAALVGDQASEYFHLVTNVQKSEFEVANKFVFLDDSYLAQDDGTNKMRDEIIDAVKGAVRTKFEA